MAKSETVKEWILAKEKLDRAKAREAELRIELCNFILQGQPKGSKKATIGKFNLTATAKLNQKVLKDELKSIWVDLNPNQRKCFKFDPKTVTKEINKLEPDSIVFKAIEEKPGMPALSIKQPKEK